MSTTNGSERPVLRAAALVAVGLRELAEAWSTNRAVLFAAAHGGITDRSDTELRRRALDVLAYGEAIAAAIVASRPEQVAEAARRGASVEDMCAATGLDADEVAMLAGQGRRDDDPPPAGLSS